MKRLLAPILSLLLLAAATLLPAAAPAFASTCTAPNTVISASTSNWISSSTNNFNFPAVTGGIQVPQTMPCDTMSLSFGSSPSWGTNTGTATLFCGTTTIGTTSSFTTSSTVGGSVSSVCDNNATTGASWYLHFAFTTGSAPLPMTATITWSGNQLAAIPTPIVLPVGNANVEAHETDIPSGSIGAYRYRGVPGSPFSSAGQIAQLSVYMGANTTATTYSLGLYTESTSTHQPNVLVRACNAVQSVQGAGAAGWQTCSIEPWHVTAGQNYWLAVFAADSSHQIALEDDSVTPTTEALTSTSWTALPSTWTTSGHTQATPTVRNGSFYGAP